MLVEENNLAESRSVLAKKYGHCPLKKRPVTLVREEPMAPPSPPPSLSPHSPRPSAFTRLYVNDVDENNEPENLSTKPEDLSKTGNYPSKAASPAATITNLPEHKEWPAYVPPPQYLNRIKLELPELARPCPQYAYIPPLYAPYRSPIYDNFGYTRAASLSPPAPYYPQYSPPSPPSPVSSHSYSSPPPPPEDLSSPGSVSSDSGVSSLSVKRRREPAPRYQCPDCAKSYSTYSGLSKHQQYHCIAAEGSLAKKSFSCKFCSKVYTSLGALKMHIRTHTLPCKCHLCGKAFSRPWLLQGHIRTHTGEKPFSCHHCRRAFADRSNLRAHLQTHSDVKKYSCSACSKTFSRMSLLSKHMEGGCGSPLPLSLHYDYRPEEVPSY